MWWLEATRSSQDTPSPVPPSPGYLAHAEFANKVECAPLRHLGDLRDHRRRHDRCRFRFETETRALSVFNDLRETEV